MKKKVIGYISFESLYRLEHGGNDSKGTVPIHKKKSNTSHIEVFINVDEDGQSSDLNKRRAAAREKMKKYDD